MTYNIEWFSEDSTAERIGNLKKILEDVRPNIFAFQEVQSKRAIRQVLGQEWVVAMADDPEQQQEVGVAVRRPYRLLNTQWLFPGEAVNFAFPNRRDVLRAEVETPNNQRIVLYVVHMKSRRGGEGTQSGYSGRLETDIQREQACGMLAGYLVGRPNERSIVLGDFNDSPDDRSVNILESGNLLAKGGESRWSQPLLSNLCEELYRKDFVTIGLSNKFLGESLEPWVPGAKEANESTRGRQYRFPQDVKVSQTLFDQILVSPNLMNGATAVIYSSVAALRGKPGDTQKDARGVEYVVQGTQASDHLPVFVDLAP